MGLYLARIGRIVGQFDGEVRGLGKGDKAIEKLCAMALVLGPVIEVDDQRADLLKALPGALPPQFQDIDETITGDFRGHTSQKQFIGLGKENADGSDFGLGFLHRGQLL